ncbi:MAG: hypothetical protein AB1442_16855 [Nitrospirota bacterium]
MNIEAFRMGKDAYFTARKTGTPMPDSREARKMAEAACPSGKSIEWRRDYFDGFFSMWRAFREMEDLI